VGITAGALGAAEARLTDNVTFVAEANIETNFSDSDAARERTQVSKLRWGDSEEIAAVRPPFDLILGSDIIYHKDSNDELADTIAALSGPGTVVLWATPDGAGGDDSAPAYCMARLCLTSVRSSSRVSEKCTDLKWTISLRTTKSSRRLTRSVRRLERRQASMRSQHTTCGGRSE